MPRSRRPRRRGVSLDRHECARPTPSLPVHPQRTSATDGLSRSSSQAVVHEVRRCCRRGRGFGVRPAVTRRIAYLMAARGVRVGQILAIAFTIKPPPRCAGRW